MHKLKYMMRRAGKVFQDLRDGGKILEKKIRDGEERKQRSVNISIIAVPEKNKQK